LIQDVGLGRPGDWSRELAGRAELLAKPTDTTTIDLTYSHTQGTDGVSYYAFVQGTDIGDTKKNQPDRNLDTSDQRRINTYAAKIDQLTPFGILTSISQYAESSSFVNGDADWTPAPIVQQLNGVTVKAFNEDLRFASPNDQPVRWLLGGFFQNRRIQNDLNVFFEQNPGGNIYCGCAGGPAFSALTDDDDNKSLAWAAYGQIMADLPDGFKFNAALRYDSDKRFDQNLAIPASPTNQISATFHALQPSGTLSKQFAPDYLGYVTVGKGFRSGGFNAYTDSVASGLLVQREYPAETDINYEAGFKSQFLDHRLTVNADYFHTKFDNEQYFLVNASPPSRDIVTIRSVIFNGGELELAYLPIHALTLTATFGAAYSTITSNDIDQNDYKKRSPQGNLYTANLAAEYRQPLWSNYNALYRVDYSYKGRICYDSANDYCYGGVGFLNARMGFENDRYTFALWGKNVLSRREPLSFLPNTEGPGVSLELDNQPATYGLEVIAHF
jgi:iron complex outermembrane receptor protein